MKFKNRWRGVRAGEIYPAEFGPGDECPPELLDAATSEGVLEAMPKVDKPARKKTPAAAD